MNKKFMNRVIYIYQNTRDGIVPHVKPFLRKGSWMTGNVRIAAERWKS
jgi:hypothetical protein